MIKRLLSTILAGIIFFAGTSIRLFASTEVSNEFYFKRNDQNRIALTFDDGPHPKQTYKILEILEKYDIKATFFVVGINAKNYPEPLKLIAQKGHEIGNHTYSHRYVKGKDADAIAKDLELCKNTIYDICGATTVVFRAPGGLMDEISVSNSEVFEDYNIIYWSIDTKDWNHRAPGEIANHVLSNIKSGDIILMHDYIGYNSPTPEALEIIIPELLKRGFNFVTVSELINQS